MIKQTLLLVEDDQVLCNLLVQGLSEFEITATEDADIGFRIATRNQPSIMLLDIYLKAGDGLELCQKLRLNPLTHKIPILIFTGKGSTENMLAAYGVGADDFISKPVDLDILKARL